MTIIPPIRRSDNLLLSLYKRIYSTHPVFLFRTAFDTRQRRDAVIDDDPDLGGWQGVARED